MVHPPGRRAFLIRPGTAADLATVAAIQAAAPEASQWRPADYLDGELWLALDATGAIAGFAAARGLGGNEWELLNLAVAPAFRRQGAGRALLGELLQTHAGTWFLEVRASNHHAQALYRKMGFVIAGRRPQYYPPDEQGNREEGIVFRYPA